MPVHERPADRGRHRGRFLVARLTSELEAARRTAGLSQRELARHLRVSHMTIGRIEAGRPGVLSVELAARMAAVLGLRLSASLHPDGDPIRDAAHVALIARLRPRLGPGLRLRTEVPVPIAGDLRSADAVIDGRGVAILVEAETRIGDVQALERRINAKQRDLRLTTVVLLVADTRHNRHVVAEYPQLRSRFPVSTRAALSALAHGQEPSGDSIVFL